MQLGCTWIHTGDVAVMTDVASGKKKSGSKLRALEGAGFLDFEREGAREF